jgi:hypothetical protein
MSEISKPRWTGNWHHWEKDWARYWRDKSVKIYKEYNASAGTTKDQKALEDSLRAYANELATTVHPRLWALGQRILKGRLDGDAGTEDGVTPPTGDYAIADFNMRQHPVDPLGPDGGVIPGRTGFSGAAWIGKYELRQVYVAAKYGLIMLELAIRDAEQLTPAQLAQAKADCDTYSKWKPEQYDPRYGHMPGYPDDRYNIMCAHSWGGFMRRGKEYVGALAWLTIIRMWPIVGLENEPKPGDATYTPLPPLSDPSWQDAGHHAGESMFGQGRRSD